MIVTIDKSSGFCWGVVRTIDIAEQELSQGGELYSLGDVIHNPVEIQRLADKGLGTVTAANLETVKGKRVLIRAHGEPPATYKRAEELGITIIDATCPVVTKVQERIRKFYTDGYQIVIFGKKDHAEVLGLVGQTNGEAIVIKSLEEVGKVALDRKTVLFSQTTMDKATFHLLKEDLQKKVKELVVGSIEDEAIEFHAKDTICGQVSGRDKKIREFASANDVVVFVAGRASSNGKVLFDIAREANPKTYFVETEAELVDSWFADVARVGITGATSTPQWVMERIKGVIETRFRNVQTENQQTVIAKS
ncbi:MAG TPA: 4-hydroxy-3-methylbut-2-enyl diphosphate reductase [Bacteroidota bacterium]|nr:4-hydroxy-3-methylbut-2-enyl diphosphate reductase [Bacteroidota bacterium]